MLQNNPYNMLSETISFQNVQLIGELITLKCLRGYSAYSRQNKELTDVYTIKNGKVITIKHAVYNLVSRHVDRMRRHNKRACDIDNYTESLSVEIDHYEEKDYTEVDNKIELLNLKPRDRAVLDCYFAGMTCNEIADFLDIDRVTVWRRRQRAQVKYKSLFF